MAEATLSDLGGGLIYDSDQDITWLQDANYAMTSGYDADGRMDWQSAVDWVDDLVYGGYDDWRLPTTVDGPDARVVIGYDGTTTAGWNITTSEMGYMFYENLENLSYYATDGTHPQADFGLKNTSFFINLQPTDYWSGTEQAVHPSTAWYFSFAVGNQGGAVRFFTAPTPGLFVTVMSPPRSPNPPQCFYLGRV